MLPVEKKLYFDRILVNEYHRKFNANDGFVDVNLSAWVNFCPAFITLNLQANAEEYSYYMVSRYFARENAKISYRDALDVVGADTIGEKIYNTIIHDGVEIKLKAIVDGIVEANGKKFLIMIHPITDVHLEAIEKYHKTAVGNHFIAEAGLIAKMLGFSDDDIVLFVITKICGGFYCYHYCKVKETHKYTMTALEKIKLGIEAVNWTRDEFRNFIFKEVLSDYEYSEDYGGYVKIKGILDNWECRYCTLFSCPQFDTLTYTLPNGKIWVRDEKALQKKIGSLHDINENNLFIQDFYGLLEKISK